MSRKPYIKIVYPDASEIAMLLTEAMVNRASGRRVVETESSERESAGQDLFAGSLCCVTETSVELTLNLAPEAMDFALATLIAKNLTQSERDKAMAASDSLELDALFSPAQASAGASTCTEEVHSAPRPDDEQEADTQSEYEKLIVEAMRDHYPDPAFTENIQKGKPSFIEDLAIRIRLHKKVKTQRGEPKETVEVGKFSEKALRDILNGMIETMEKGHGTFDAVNHAVYKIKELAKAARRKLNPNGEKTIEEDPGLVDQLAVLICGAQRVTQKCTTPLKIFATDIDHYIKESFDDEAEYVVTARALARVLSDVRSNFAEDSKLTFEKALEIRARARADFEALKKDLDELDKKEPTWDDVEAEARKIGQHKADKTDDIEPGLLNDIEDGEEGEDNG